MKLAIIGSRTSPPVDIESHLKNIPDTIVSGGAIGADTYAREFARKKGLRLIEYFPNYEKYGKVAPSSTFPVKSQRNLGWKSPLSVWKSLVNGDVSLSRFISVTN